MIFFPRPTQKMEYCHSVRVDNAFQKESSTNDVFPADIYGGNTAQTAIKLRSAAGANVTCS